MYFAAPKLKGRPRRKRKKRDISPDESSNESEASVASSVTASTSTRSLHSRRSERVERPERKPSDEEKKFIDDIHGFMNSHGTPLGKMPLLGYRQSKNDVMILGLKCQILKITLFLLVDLFLFYTKVQELGGYEKVSINRLWKSIFDELGGNANSTSAATITRRHYEK